LGRGGGQTTAGGTLGLYQTATGGAGGTGHTHHYVYHHYRYSYGGPGDGGTATSSLTFNDLTANTTHASTLTGYSTAIGGARGSGTGGAAGGAATAAIALTGAHTVTATSAATGGAGVGGTATATAIATTGSTTEAATAHAKATTANGALATATATATGATGSDDSTAVTQSSGVVTTVSAFAQAPVGGTTTTLAESNSDNQLGSSGFNGIDDNSYAFATELPNSSLVTGILNANSNLETALGSGTVFGLGTEGASLVELENELIRQERERRQIAALQARQIAAIYLYGRVDYQDLWRKAERQISGLGIEVKPGEPEPADVEESERFRERAARIASRCDAMLLVGAEGFALDDDIDLIGLDRRNFIRSRFQKYLPCAVVDCAGIRTSPRVRAAQNRGIDWLDGSNGWPESLKGWLQQASARAADSYGVAPVAGDLAPGE
jgi:hypothetical protein